MEITDVILRIMELLGTVAFAVSGVAVAVRKELDFFGAVVLGVITAVGGGLLRDVLLGQIPPVMFRNYLFVTVAFITSCLVFFTEYFESGKYHKQQDWYLQAINFFDSVGLGVFTAVGVNTAIVHQFGGNGFLTVFVGAITGIGGGMIRDVLAGEIPMVLIEHRQIYALAAIIGGTFHWFLYHQGVGLTTAMLSGSAAVLFIRFLAWRYHWELPKISK